ncbi:MAG: transglutaminase domain-containing protein [Fimbriimonadaceae bacterium]|nr:transglutaminase domain-containing protein [Fimbriimonadaceae bacterium]
MARHLLNLVLALAACPLAQTAPTPVDGPKTLTTRFTYKAVVPKIPNGARALDLWLPLPSDNAFQHVSDVVVTSPTAHRITQEPKFNNRMVYVHADGAKAPFTVEVAFTVQRTEAAILAGSAPGQVDASKAVAFLEPDAKVPVGGRFGTIANEVTSGQVSAIDKVRAEFDHVVATMEYDYKKESPQLGDGDVPFVCDYKKGNCSDLHSYLISLARSEGIPAYLEYGFPIAGVPVANPLPMEGKIGGYHCWTWFQDQNNRWLPVDASDGRRWKDSGDSRTSAHMFGNLILERSAVAMSRGRDLVLAPPQKQGPRNYFIYPYAEADGNTIDATWELSYKVLELKGGDMQQQMDELRRLVMSQQAEIAALKAANGSGAKPQTPVAPSTGEKIGVYGFVRLDAISDSHKTSGTQTPQWVLSDSTAGSGNAQFAMHPRLTRLGFNLAAPSGAVKGWDVTGKIELDFQNGGSESRETPRARILYVDLKNGPTSWRIGQDWDLISPLFPSPNDDTMMWNAGNLGDRRPQVRFTYAPENQPTTFAVALGLTGAIDAKDMDMNGTRDGEESGAPHVQARFGFKGANVQGGVWGLAGTERTATAVGGETRFQSKGIGVDASVNLGGGGDLRGEWWSGENLSDFRGGIGQGVNTTTGNEIQSSGGWAELGYKSSPNHRIAVGYTIDDPRDGDVASGGRIRNRAWYVHNKWTLGSGLEIGLNYINWTTDWKGMSSGTDNRFNLYVAHKF